MLVVRPEQIVEVHGPVSQEPPLVAEEPSVRPDPGQDRQGDRDVHREGPGGRPGAQRVAIAGCRRTGRPFGGDGRGGGAVATRPFICLRVGVGQGSNASQAEASAPAGVGLAPPESLPWTCGTSGQFPPSPGCGKLSKPLHRGKLHVTELHFVVDIEPTNRCNADCHFCPRDMTPHQGLMSWETFEQALMRADELEVARPRSTVNLCGLGEPLLNKHAPSWSAGSASEGFGCGMSSNASLLDEKKAQAPRRSRPPEDLHQRRRHRRRLRGGLQAPLREDPRQHPPVHRDVQGRHRGPDRPRRLPPGQEPCRRPCGATGRPSASTSSWSSRS